MAASLRQLVKSKIFRTVKFIPLGGDLLSRLVTGCMKRFDIDDDDKLRFTTTAFNSLQERRRPAKKSSMSGDERTSAISESVKT